VQPGLGRPYSWSLTTNEYLDSKTEPCWMPQLPVSPLPATRVTFLHHLSPHGQRSN
jgi:hypothetical protein